MTKTHVKISIMFDDEQSGKAIDLGHATMCGDKCAYEPPQSLKTYPPGSREDAIQACLVAVLLKTERP